MKRILLKSLTLVCVVCLLLSPAALLGALGETEPQATGPVDEMVDEMTVTLAGDEETSASISAADAMPVNEDTSANSISRVPVVKMVADCKKTVNVGQRFQLDHGDLKLLSYSSSDNWSVADCDKGLIYAKRVGSTKIIALFSGGKKLVMYLTVVDPSAPNRVEIKKPASTQLDIQRTLRLKAVLYPSKADSDLIWKSSAEGIATVNDAGLVTPHNVGKVTITVTTLKGNKTDRITLKIVDNTMPTSITLNKSGIVDLDMSSTLRLNATLKPAGASSGIVWSSNFSGIARVSNGVVYPVSTGTATITATTVRGNLKASVRVHVINRSVPTSITVNFASPQYLDLQETLLLRYTLSPVTAQSDVVWVSNDKRVATVRSGQVVPVRKGTATITGTTVKGGKKCSFKVIVVDKHAPTSVSIHRDSKKSIRVGKIRTMGYTVGGWKGYNTNYKLHWQSSNSKVIKVTNSTKGVFEALKPGKARITVTTDNGFKDSFTIRVTK